MTIFIYNFAVVNNNGYFCAKNISVLLALNLVNRMKLSFRSEFCAVAVMFALLFSLPGNADGIYGKYRTMPLGKLCNDGYAFIKAGKTDSALLYLSVVAGRYDEAKLDGNAAYLSAKSMNTIGFLYSTRFHNYDKAMQYYTRAEVIAAKHGFKDLQAKCLLNLGSLYRQYDLIHGTSKMGLDAISIYKKSYALGLKVKDWNLVVLSMFDMLGVADGYGMYRQIDKEINGFLQLKMPHNVPLAHYVRSMAKGLVALNQKKYDAALSHFSSMRRLAERLAQSDFYCISADICRSKAYSDKGDPRQALAVAMGIDSLARAGGYDEILLGNLSEMERLHKQIGEQGKARICRGEYLELKERIVSSTKIDDVRDAKFLNEIDRMGRELKAERLDNEKRSSRMWFFAAASFAILFVGMFAVLYVRRSSMLRAKPDGVDKAQKKEPKYSQSTLTEADKSELYEKIKHVMETSPDIYGNDFKLVNLSEKVGVHYRFVSQVINEKYGKSFKLMLNDYRIKEACRRLKDNGKYGGYTIEAVASSVGFKSRSNFVAVFKRETGFTPKEFMKES